MGSKDWDKADDILKDASLVIVSVPIDRTELVIRKLSNLPSDCILADFTSTKTMPLNVMLDVHKGPVVGLHPMFGPDISNLAKQLIIWVEGRNNEQCQWLREQMRLWGANIVESTAKQHDEAMGYIQALRHFTTFCYGIYLAKDNPDLQQIMQLSSPIYHMELMMVGRLFAQDASLYADIILSNNNNIEIIERYINVLQDSLSKIKAGDRESFIENFNVAKEYFGEFSTMFMKESKSLLAKMHDAKMIKNN
jgi:chorismate mutase/prephenate dehydrogenase